MGWKPPELRRYTVSGVGLGKGACFSPMPGLYYTDVCVMECMGGREPKMCTYILYMYICVCVCVRVNGIHGFQDVCRFMLVCTSVRFACKCYKTSFFFLFFRIYCKLALYILGNHAVAGLACLCTQSGEVVAHIVILLLAFAKTFWNCTQRLEMSYFLLLSPFLYHEITVGIDQIESE